MGPGFNACDAWLCFHQSGTAYAFQTPALPLTRLHHQPQLQNRIATSIEEHLILPLKMTQVSLFSTNIRKYGSVSLQEHPILC
jgi:hypothetical protein